jgi:general secretion pathway protein G
MREARARHDEGFTLIELLIVIIVLGILAGIVVFSVAQFKKDATDSACKADLKTLNVASEAYYAQHSAYAATVNDLVTGKYLKSAPTELDFSFNGAAATPANTWVSASNCAS